jgi:7-carboxy-7-deazaguanine synthase
MRIAEIIYSIQGEGIHQGLPTVFVRLQGCNLASAGNCCSYCDTAYAQDENKKVENLNVDQVIQRIVKLNPRPGARICITGGEPLFHPEVEKLVATLNKFNYFIEIFTNGTIPRPLWWTRVASWIADIKCPSAGVKVPYSESWFETRTTDQVKLTVADDDDLKFAHEIVNKCACRNPQVIVSPVFPLGADRDLLTPSTQKWMQTVVEFCKDRNVRYSLQIHKIVWGNRIGV